jgi:hypothetical protein
MNEVFPFDTGKFVGESFLHEYEIVSCQEVLAFSSIMATYLLPFWKSYLPFLSYKELDFIYFILFFFCTLYCIAIVGIIIWDTEIKMVVKCKNVSIFETVANP